ncbi:arginine deiminase family protein [Mycoplasma bradburyae]|uniref:Arginine deiminase family protein n=1 Tax=Mycoplasma bradburyae TaxID=2963128 RepID=A0AAW6HPS0_9MOLU|nr:arginine deiminase family protein [Mycoplasma bradburyae]MDC4183402.1 arginine deiminase family protein [Mycoplasma bradburyae]
MAPKKKKTKKRTAKKVDKKVDKKNEVKAKAQLTTINDLTNRLKAKTSVDFNVYSNASKLKEVIIYRPGIEVERIIKKPNKTFSSSKHLERIQKEHDILSAILQKSGVKVHYLNLMLASALDQIDVSLKEEFIQRFIIEAKVTSLSAFDTLFNYFRSFDSNLEMINAMIAGVKKNEVPSLIIDRFSDLVLDDSAYYIEPLNDFLLQSKYFSTIGNGVVIYKHNDPYFNRHTLFYEYLVKFHPRFNNVKVYFSRDNENCYLSSDDILLVNNDTLLISVSQNTNILGIEVFARNLYNDPDNKILRIIVCAKKNSDEFISMNQLITSLDYDKFIVNQKVIGEIIFFELLDSEQKDLDGLNKLDFRQIEITFEELIELLIKRRPKFILSGGGDEMNAISESNNSCLEVLMMKSNEVIVYDRNKITNHLLLQQGLIVHYLPSAELSRTNGGVNNLVIPLIRE